MSTLPSKSKLDEYIKIGLIRKQRHPTLPLSIYVYTRFAQYERLWNNVTLVCRGLVLDESDRCVVRCMPKFFNEGEPHALCDRPTRLSPNTSVIFDKVDGSMIQVANDHEYGLIVTSKASFASKHVVWAQEIIDEQFDAQDFKPRLTYIFELVHPENRQDIVINYGDTRQMFLIAVKDTETGKEYDIFDTTFDKFEKVPVIHDLDKHLASKDIEGAVVKTGDHRYKVKTDEYIRLHRIVSDFTPKRVWEALRDGNSLEFTDMPEEFEEWLQSTIREIKDKYVAIFDEALAEYDRTKDWTDKEIGVSQDVQYKHLVFLFRTYFNSVWLRLDRAARYSKKIDQHIWKMVKPKEETTDETKNA